MVVGVGGGVCEVWCAEIFEIVSELSVFPVMLDEKRLILILYIRIIIFAFSEKKEDFFFFTFLNRKVQES